MINAPRLSTVYRPAIVLFGQRETATSGPATEIQPVTDSAQSTSENTPANNQEHAANQSGRLKRGFQKFVDYCVNDTLWAGVSATWLAGLGVGHMAPKFDPSFTLEKQKTMGIVLSTAGTVALLAWGGPKVYRRFFQKRAESLPVVQNQIQAADNAAASPEAQSRLQRLKDPLIRATGLSGAYSLLGGMTHIWPKLSPSYFTPQKQETMGIGLLAFGGFRALLPMLAKGYRWAVPKQA